MELVWCGLRQVMWSLLSAAGMFGHVTLGSAGRLDYVVKRSGCEYQQAVGYTIVA